MNIISFPCVNVEFNYELDVFSTLGFDFVDNGIEGSYIKLPEGWSADYQYHTPFEFFMIVTDNKRRLRANAIFIGQTAKIELLTRYSIVNYKPWLSPYKSELRLMDNSNGHNLFTQSYIPKLIPNKTSTDLVPSQNPDDNESSYELAYKNLVKYCIRYNIDLNSKDPTLYW